MYDKIRLKFAKLFLTHGLPKIHKAFKSISSFRPTVSTTGTAHYSVGKDLSELLNLLTHNDCFLKDSFEEAMRIIRIFPQVRQINLSHLMFFHYSETCR